MLKAVPGGEQSWNFFQFRRPDELERSAALPA